MLPSHRLFIPLLALLITLTRLAPGCAAAEEPPAPTAPTLRLAMSGAFQPFSTTDAAGRLVGFDADVATLPECRGRGMASFLLARMEEEMARSGILTAFTIARAYSHGMNVTFARGGYTFAGTLSHNTGISGALESMNVWYKTLRP